jgi:hypothetical protein
MDAEDSDNESDEEIFAYSSGESESEFEKPFKSLD